MLRETGQENDGFDGQENEKLDFSLITHVLQENLSRLVVDLSDFNTHVYEYIVYIFYLLEVSKFDF